VPRQSDVSSLLLGVPAFALAFAITTVSVLVPLTLERRAASPLLIGMVVAGEGLIALSLPLGIGPLSDRTQSTWGGRLPYVMLGCALCARAARADRQRAVRVRAVGSEELALGLFLPCITRSLCVLIPAMPLGDFGGTVVMTLSYTLVALAGTGHSPVGERGLV
jgi:MFS family permease